MGVTIIGPRAATFPETVCAPLVDLKPTWSDAWRYVPELRLERGAVHSATHGLSECQVSAPYGSVKHPWEADLAVRGSVDLRGWWLRLRLASNQGPQTVFVGRITAETRELWGADIARSGQQTWTAYGPGRLLRRIHVSRSFWLDTTDPLAVLVRELGWVPAMNGRDWRGLIVGNRSAVVYQSGGSPSADDVHLYDAGTYAQTWSHYEYIRYLLAKFVTEDGSTGPKWRLGGHTDPLENLQSVVDWSVTQTVADMLGQLIPPKLGVDYVIRNTGDGFEVHVFSLTAADHSFGGATLPKNPNTVTVRVGQSKCNTRTVIEQTDDHRYGKIRVLGARAIVCCSLGGDLCTVTEIAGTLANKWISPLVTLYKQAGGVAAMEPADHDRIRGDERFRAVYQAFGAPADWDRAAAKCAPSFAEDGSFDAETDGDYQLTVRETLSWIPLRENINYSVDPVIDSNPLGHVAEFLSPCVWVSAPAVSDRFGYTFYERSDTVGVGVSVAQQDWGIWLSATPNHLVAYGHFVAGGIAKPTTTNPVYDYDYQVVTLALRTDQRVIAEMEIPGGSTPSDGVMEIVDEGIECWILAPHTVVGLDDDGRLLTSGDSARILRNDDSRLAQVMAGALSRYYQQRARAEILIEGLRPWQGLVGQILTVIEQAGDSTDVQAPITSVEWVSPETGDAQTVVRTGFAQ